MNPLIYNVSCLLTELKHNFNVYLRGREQVNANFLPKKEFL